MNYEQIKLLIESDTNSILDIGAHFGDFTKGMKQQLPVANYFMIEANPECEYNLKQISFADYNITLLSDEEKEVTYYVNKNDLTSTGNSYYKETTDFFSEGNVLEKKVKAMTLDNLFPDQIFDFIKIDTQGSEIDIIKGGKDLVSKAKYILLECSIEKYNEGAPLVDDVKTFMNSIGFIDIAIVEEHYFDNKLFQQDILFKNTK
jgi:FkbM family methyltransferase